MPRPKDSYVLPWHETNNPVVGDGLSRTSNPAARLWQVDVQFKNGPSMKTTVKAMTKQEAIKFTKNRHPDASHINVLGKL
jgi:hypothetical protein